MMKMFTKVLFNLLYAGLIVLACGGLLKNLNFISYFDWFDTILCFVVAFLAKKMPDIFFMEP